jgi:predicted methyltransferase
MLKCSFVEGPILHRLKYGKGRGQNLAKAVGMKSNKNRNIIDATAGLGYDAFILASLGANVTLIEWIINGWYSNDFSHRLIPFNKNMSTFSSIVFINRRGCTFNNFRG